MKTTWHYPLRLKRTPKSGRLLDDLNRRVPPVCSIDRLVRVARDRSKDGDPSHNNSDRGARCEDGNLPARHRLLGVVVSSTCAGGSEDILDHRRGLRFKPGPALVWPCGTRTRIGFRRQLKHRGALASRHCEFVDASEERTAFRQVRGAASYSQCRLRCLASGPPSERRIFGSSQICPHSRELCLAIACLLAYLLGVGPPLQHPPEGQP